MDVEGDFLVIGSGIAGLRAALSLADAGDVIVLTKAEPRESNTGYAQGGIAAAIGPDDSPELHARDTIAAGDGLCVAEAVDVLVHEGPRYVQELLDWGAAFDRDALRQRLERVNQQEEVFDGVRQLIATAPECPVRMSEQITNVMATQWVRGSDWALGHARAFRDEVARRVDAGTAACPGERARLMWIGAGLWHDTAFYTAFESSHRAVFVWSMYLAFGPDGYIRYGLDEPMAALASRTARFNEYLHNPPWAAEWIVHQAREHRIDGALVLRPRSMKPAATGRLFIERALEEAGIPVLPIEADVVDARDWDADAARAGVCSFLDTRVLQ